jgi:hypothetical protein
MTPSSLAPPVTRGRPGGLPAAARTPPPGCGCPEMEILLAAARVDGGPSSDAAVCRLAEGGVDWERVLAMGSLHGLLPLLHRRIDDLCPEAPPPEVVSRLRDHYLANHRRNLFLWGELCRVLELLRSEDIPAATYKGIALAASAYGDLSLRQFTDLDLLVQPQDAGRAVEILASRGYGSRFPLTAAARRRYLREETEILLSRHDDRLFLELHWSLAPRYLAFPFDLAPLWKRMAAAASRADLPSLSSEETLVIITAHGSKHLWKRLIWVSDVARLLASQPALDWDEVFRQVTKLGAKRMLSLGLLLSRELLGAELPRETARWIESDPGALRLSAEIRSRVRSGLEAPEGALQRFLFHLRMRERSRDRIRFAARLARKRSHEDRAFPSSPLLLPLGCLSRSLRLFWKYGLRPLLPGSAKNG